MSLYVCNLYHLKNKPTFTRNTPCFTSLPDKYQQILDSARHESPKQVPVKQEPLWWGGGPHEQREVPRQEPSKQELPKQGISGKRGMIGSMYPHIVGGMAPGGGGEPSTPGKGGPPEDKSDDGSTEEEDEADEETVSVTSSSQVSVSKTKPKRWDKKKEMYVGGTGGPPEETDDPSRGGDGRDTSCGPRGHRGQRGRTGPPEWDGAPGPMEPVGPRCYPGRDGLSTTVGPLTSIGLGAPPVFNANLSTIRMENSLHYLGESLHHVMQFKQNVNLKYGGAFEHDCSESIFARSSFESAGRKYPSAGV